MLPLFLRRPTRRLAGALLIAGLTFGAGAAASAANLVVTSTADSGTGSLRAAVSAAASGDTISFAVTGTITLASQLTLSQGVTLQGPGASSLAVDGGGTTRVLEISNGASATLSGLTIQNGSVSSGLGGGVLVDSGATAAITDSTLTLNSAPAGGGLGNNGTAILTGCTLATNSAAASGGGALYNAGTVTLTECTLTGNTAPSGGGLYSNGTATLAGCALTGNTTGIGSGGGLYINGTATLTGCALTGNSAQGNGGAIAKLPAGSLTLTNCVLRANSALNASGGGIDLASGPLTLTNCALAGNQAMFGGGVSSAGTLTLTGCTFTGNSGSSHGGGFNYVTGSATLTNDILYGDASASGGEVYTFNAASAANVNVFNSDIGQTGGFTGHAGDDNAFPGFVHATAPYDLHLASGSPAPGSAGAPGYQAFDLDGRPRAGTPAVGAYEAAPAGAYPLVVAYTLDGVPQSLRAAVACADDYAGAGIIFDTANAFATFQTITLTGGQLTLSHGLTLTGPAAGVAVDGDHASRVFEVSGSATLAGLTIQNGVSSGARGGGVAVDAAATATLSGCTLTGNSADTYGGGLDNLGSGTATLTGCTLTGNSAGLLGGGLSSGGTATLTDCTLAGNSATNGGGGLNNGPSSTMTVTGCTLTGNGSTGAGGGFSNGGAATLTDDILYGDTAPEIDGSVTASFCDVEGGVAGTGDIDADPLLASLGGYGGPTATLALLPGSPCLGAGVAATGVTADQRGVPIPQGGRYDIGAFESRGFTLTPGGGSGQSAPLNTAFASPLVVAVASAFGEPVEGGRVTLTAPAGGASASLAADPAPIAADGTASATATANGTVGGPYTVTAAANGASGTPAFSLTNSQAAPSVAVTSSSSLVASVPTSVYGQPVTFTVTVGGPSGDGTPTGTVTLGGLPGGPQTLTLSGGQATYTTTAASPLPVGADTLTVSYGGDVSFSASGGTLTQDVNKAPTTTGLTSGAATSGVGRPVTLTASVGVTGPGAGTPTGTVTFTDTTTSPATTLGTATLTGGTATLTTVTLGVGPHAVTASYGGDADFLGSATTAPLTQTVLAVLHTLPAGLQMIALTESYGGPASAWSAPAGLPLDNWSGTAYVLTTSLPAPGRGAWVRPALPVSIYDTGTPVPATGPFSVPLMQGWNLVGDPFAASVALSGLSASAGGTTYSLGGPQPLVYTTLYTYPAGATQYQVVGPGGSLAPFAGYWLYAFRPCTLLVPAP